VGTSDAGALDKDAHQVHVEGLRDENVATYHFAVSIHLLGPGGVGGGKYGRHAL